MTIHVISEKNADGNPVRMYFFCGEYCMRMHLHRLGISTFPNQVVGETKKYSWRPWSGENESIHDVHCGFCDRLIWQSE